VADRNNGWGSGPSLIPFRGQCGAVLGWRTALVAFLSRRDPKGSASACSLSALPVDKARFPRAVTFLQPVITSHL